MLALTAGLAFLLTPVAATATTPASPGPVTGGSFCADTAHGDERPGTQGHWYVCGQDPRGEWRWLPIGAPCTHDGYGKTCTPPCQYGGNHNPCTSPKPSKSTSASPSGSPKPSKSTSPAPSTSSSEPTQLPVTSSTSGKLVAGSITGGILLILAGAAFMLWRPRRPAQHRQRPGTTA